MSRCSRLSPLAAYCGCVLEIRRKPGVELSADKTGLGVVHTASMGLLDFLPEDAASFSSMRMKIGPDAKK